MTRDEGFVSNENWKQRCRLSVRGCMRASITLSVIGDSYVKRVTCLMEYRISLFQAI
jgi:hypothetical protein